MFAKHLKGFLQFGIFVQKNRASTVCQYKGQCYTGVLTSFVGYTDFLIYSDLNNGKCHHCFGQYSPEVGSMERGCLTIKIAL